MPTDHFPSLDRIEIATPCDMLWNEMQGDDHVRRCAQCELNVFDLSSLSHDEAEKLVFATEGRVCVRMFRRFDGTIITRDCPVALRLLRRRLARSLAAIGALVAFLTCGAAFGHLSTGNPTRSTVDGPLTKLIQLIDPLAYPGPNVGSIEMGLMAVANPQTPAAGGKAPPNCETR